MMDVDDEIDPFGRPTSRKAAFVKKGFEQILPSWDAKNVIMGQLAVFARA